MVKAIYHLISNARSLNDCSIGGNFFPNIARSNWLLQGHMTSHNELFLAEISERATLRNL